MRWSGMLGGGSGVVGSSDVNRSSDDGGSTGLRHDSNVGAAGGVGETRESFASTWARGINRAQMPATPMLVRLVAWEKRMRASPASGLGASSRAQMPQIHVGVRVESG